MHSSQVPWVSVRSDFDSLSLTSEIQGTKECNTWSTTICFFPAQKFQEQEQGKINHRLWKLTWRPFLNEAQPYNSNFFGFFSASFHIYFYNGEKPDARLGKPLFWSPFNTATCRRKCYALNRQRRNIHFLEGKWLRMALQPFIFG